MSLTAVINSLVEDGLLDESRRTGPTSLSKTLDERGRRYGPFVGHAQITQRLKNAYRAHAVGQGIELAPDMMEALDMVMHKVGRIVNGDPTYADSWVDIAGYAKLVADRLEGVVR